LCAILFHIPRGTPTPPSPPTFFLHTPETSAKKNLLSKLRVPKGMGVAFAALKCRPAVCYSFFPLVKLPLLLQFAILIYEFARGGEGVRVGDSECGISPSMR